MEYDKDPESAFKGNGNTYKDVARSEELQRLVGILYAENDFFQKNRRASLSIELRNSLTPADLDITDGCIIPTDRFFDKPVFFD